MFYWRNDTPAFVTRPNSSPNQFVPEIVSPLSCSSRLVRHILPFVYFFKISFIGSLDECHISVFNALMLNSLANKPWFLRVCSTNHLKTLGEKEKLLVTSIFSFSHSVFYPFEELSAIFIKFEIVVCKLFQFERVLNLSFGKGLNAFRSLRYQGPYSPTILNTIFRSFIKICKFE